jgi:hypothetical protein
MDILKSCKCMVKEEERKFAKARRKEDLNAKESAHKSILSILIQKYRATKHTQFFFPFFINYLSKIP